MAAARLERARGALAGLEAALALGEEEEEGDGPARLLVEHLVDTRRKQKLLLAQLRVLRQLLGVLEHPGPPRPSPSLRAAGAQARGRWRGLKGGYGGAVAALGGALPPALAQRGRGRRLRQRLRGALGARLRQKEELETKLREAAGRREQLRRRLEAQRGERRGRQGALRRQQGAARRGTHTGGAGGRAGAGCRLYQRLAGVGGPPLPPGSSELRPPPPSPCPPLTELPVGPPE